MKVQALLSSFCIFGIERLPDWVGDEGWLFEAGSGFVNLSHIGQMHNTWLWVEDDEVYLGGKLKVHPTDGPGYGLRAVEFEPWVDIEKVQPGDEIWAVFRVNPGFRLVMLALGEEAQHLVKAVERRAHDIYWSLRRRR